MVTPDAARQLRFFFFFVRLLVLAGKEQTALREALSRLDALCFLSSRGRGGGAFPLDVGGSPLSPPASATASGKSNRLARRHAVEKGGREGGWVGREEKGTRFRYEGSADAMTKKKKKKEQRLSLRSFEKAGTFRCLQQGAVKDIRVEDWQQRACFVSPLRFVRLRVSAYPIQKPEKEKTTKEEGALTQHSAV